MDKWRRNDNNYASLWHDEKTAPKDGVMHETLTWNRASVICIY